MAPDDVEQCASKIVAQRRRTTSFQPARGRAFASDLASARIACHCSGSARSAPLDPATLTVAILVLTACAMAASWIPARRAARLDPAPHCAWINRSSGHGRRPAESIAKAHTRLQEADSEFSNNSSHPESHLHTILAAGKAGEREVPDGAEFRTALSSGRR